MNQHFYAVFYAVIMVGGIYAAGEVWPVSISGIKHCKWVSKKRIRHYFFHGGEF